MKFILATKLNMTQIFDKDGIVHPATAVLATAECHYSGQICGF